MGLEENGKLKNRRGKSSGWSEGIGSSLDFARQLVRA